MTLLPDFQVNSSLYLKSVITHADRCWVGVWCLCLSVCVIGSAFWCCTHLAIAYFPIPKTCVLGPKKFSFLFGHYLGPQKEYKIAYPDIYIGSMGFMFI